MQICVRLVIPYQPVDKVYFNTNFDYNWLKKCRQIEKYI